MSLVILGLDGFHTDLLEYTPSIRNQFKNHGGNELKSTVPPVTAPAWASFQTGVNQGKHGIFDFVTYNNSLKMSLLDGSNLRFKTVYEYLDDAGYQCYIQNLPFAMPARVGGDILPSWLDPDGMDPAPPSLLQKYDIERPRYPELNGETVENINEMHSCFSHNASIFKSVFDRRDHDFYFHLVSVTDWLQHETYVELIRNPHSEIASRAKALLEAVDEFVKEVVTSASEDVDILLISDHGFRLFEGQFSVNDWLERNGYLTVSSDGHRFTTKDENQQEVIEAGAFGHWIKNRSFWPLLRPIKSQIEQYFSVKFTPERGIGLESSMAYCRSKDEKAIRFNYQHPDVDSETVNQINQELRQLDYVNSNLASNIFSGPFDESGGGIILQDKSHLVRRGPVGDIVTNDTVAHHSEYGIIAPIGSEFASLSSEADIIDILPTILHYFDCPIPTNIDGNVLTSIFQKEESVQYTQSESYEPKFNLTEELKDDAVTERLDNLGYL